MVRGDTRLQARSEPDCPVPAAASSHVRHTAAVQVKGLSKFYGGPSGVAALSDVSFDIREREFLSILGPSGCGKSTLLRIIAGLLPYDHGDVAVLGQRVSGPHAELGVVFQTSNLLPWLTLEKNVRLAAEIGRLPKPAIASKIAELLPVLGLQGFETRYPHELSGGMQQRAALGQALMLSPRILLLDEPFGALDALTRDRLNVELLRIWEAQRQAILLITHSIAEAIFLSDRVLVMSPRPGRLVHEVEIDLPRPRHPRRTRELPAFGLYVGQLTEIMGVA